MEKANYVIAGGSSGIGEALSLALLDKGHEVYVYARNRHALPEHPSLHFHAVDFTEEQFELPQLPANIQGLAYCPGSIQLQPFHRMQPDLFLSDFRINVLGAVRCVQLCLPAMKANQQASVVLFSTVAVQTGMGFHASIAASKGAIEGLTRSLSAEYASSHIRFNCIAPSLTASPLAEKLLNTPEKVEAAAKRHPLGRAGKPSDSANAAAYLLDPNAGWITGQIIGVDGGMSAIRLL
ncbi:MAG: hypothetical protein RLZZ543_1559 [Bacteroidota bacterium]|jgi:NAD(P)-dependent dehydrogenase (short-subunit alcohol dehydrogenase family)